MSVTTRSASNRPMIAGLMAYVAALKQQLLGLPVIQAGFAEIARNVRGIQVYGHRQWLRRETHAMQQRRKRRRLDGASRTVRAGQALGDNLVNVVLVIVIASVIGYVGVSVMSTTEDTVSVTANSAFDNATTSLTTGTETAFSLIEVVYIVLLLGIIVGALVFLRGGGGRR